MGDDRGNPMSHSIDSLRRRAKALRRSYEAGESAAIQRLKVHSPRSQGDLRHADFLYVIAREAGFLSWPSLKLAAQTHGLDRAQRLQRLKIALWNRQGAIVERLLADTPDLAEGLFGLQVALLNLPVVEAMLGADPGLATRPAGPRRPILHLAFSCRLHQHPELAEDMLAIAELLVAHGADVNDTFTTSQNDHPLSALYGAIAHSNNMVLARWLLEHGANPNDGESLYHATELGHHEGLKLLLDHKADPTGTNALLRAMDFHDTEAVGMLLAAGGRADEYVGEPANGEAPRVVVPVLHHAARRMSDSAMIALLLENGADSARMYEGVSAYGLARAYGNAALAQAMEVTGNTTELSSIEQWLADAADGLSVEGRFLDPARLPEPYRNLMATLVHLPGKLAHMQRLAVLGLEYDRPDTQGVTPVQLAGWEGLPELMAWLLSMKPDLAHINDYGGTLLSSIVHGSENCPNRANRDHIACAKLALEQGVALPIQQIELAGDPGMEEFLHDWADAHPGQVVT